MKGVRGAAGCGADASARSSRVALKSEEATGPAGVYSVQTLNPQPDNAFCIFPSVSDTESSVSSTESSVSHTESSVSNTKGSGWGVYEAPQGARTPARAPPAWP